MRNTGLAVTLHAILVGFGIAIVACGGGKANEPPPTAGTTVAPSASAEAKPPEPKKPEEPPAPASKKGAGDFPLPADADDGSAAPGGGGKIVVYKVMRGRDAVVAEVKALAQKDGWTVVSEDTSPKGALRTTWTKGGSTVKSSMLGDATQTGIILTVM